MAETDPEQLRRENARLKAEVARLQERLAASAGRDDTGAPAEAVTEEQRHREFCELLINSATIGIAVVHGPDHVYEYANPVYLALVGARDRPITGLPLAQALSPSAAAGEKWLLDAVYQNGKVVSVGEYETQIEGQEAYWDIDHIPLRNHGSEIERVLIIARDITQDVRSRRTIALSADMERSTQTLRTLIDILPAGVIVSDAAGHIIMENDASRRLTEGPATGDAYQPRGRYQLLYLNGQPFPVSELPMPRALQEGAASENTEILYRFEDGRESIISASGSPVRNERGELVGALVVLMDITERKAIEREREQRLAQQVALIDASYRIIAKQSIPGLLQAVADAARDLTGARLAAFGHVYEGGRFVAGAVAGSLEGTECSPGASFEVRKTGVHMRLLSSKRVLRLTQDELESGPEWWGLPEGHPPLRGLMGAPLLDVDGEPIGLLLLTDKQGGDFTHDDEALLVQLTTLTSLAMQHIEAREEVEARMRELQATFAAVTDIILVFDADGRVVQANEAANRQYGVDPSRLTVPQMDERLHPRHPDGRPYEYAERPVILALKGTSVYDQTVVFTGPHGRDVVVSVSAAPLRHDNEIVGAVSVWRDITERFELQVQIDKERRLLEAVFSASVDLMLVYDATGKMVRTNEAAQREYGFDPLSWDRETMVRSLQPRHPDGSLLKFSEVPSSRALAGERVVDETVAITVPDGRTLYVSNAAAPMRDESGAIIGAVAVWRNITERYELQIRLDEERRLLEAVLRQMPGAIVIAQAPSGKTLMVNERLRDYLLETFEAEAIEDYAQYQGLRLDGRRLQPEDWPLARALQRGETVTNELITLVRRDGSRLVLSMSAAPVLDAEGHIIAGVASMYEVDPTTFTPKY